MYTGNHQRILAKFAGLTQRLHSSLLPLLQRQTCPSNIENDKYIMGVRIIFIQRKFWPIKDCKQVTSRWIHWPRHSWRPSCTCHTLRPLRPAASPKRQHALKMLSIHIFWFVYMRGLQNEQEDSPSMIMPMAHVCTLWENCLVTCWYLPPFAAKLLTSDLISFLRTKIIEHRSLVKKLVAKGAMSI